jgi:hypothetical protein
METRHAGIFLLMAAVFALPMGAQNPQRGTLKGLQSVGVRLEASESDAKLIDRSALRTIAELRIRQNGIKVPDTIEGVAGRPQLIIRFAFYDVSKSTGGRTGGYAVSVECMLEQDVHLDRNRSWAKAVTWSALVIATTNSDVIGEHSERMTSKLVEQFVNDFLAENPR